MFCVPKYNENNKKSDALSNEIHEKLILKTKNKYDKIHVSYYCVGEFEPLKDYFKGLKIKEIDLSDLNLLLKRIPPTEILLLKVFLRHMNKTLSQEEKQDTGFWHNYY